MARDARRDPSYIERKKTRERMERCAELDNKTVNISWELQEDSSGSIKLMNYFSECGRERDREVYPQHEV